MSKNQTAFDGMPCDHEGDVTGQVADGAIEIHIQCDKCGCDNSYYMDLNTNLKNLAFEFYEEVQICRECEETEGECDCHKCSACGESGYNVDESECDECGHDHDDPKCDCETCKGDDE